MIFVMGQIGYGSQQENLSHIYYEDHFEDEYHWRQGQRRNLRLVGSTCEIRKGMEWK